MLGLCLCAAVAPYARAQDEAAPPARVVGTVVADESGEPIEAVSVRLLAAVTQLGGLTDGRGVFAFPRVAPGVYELLVEHLGYEVRSDSIEVVSGEVHAFEVRLKMQPIELEPLIVTVRRWYVSPLLWGFYDRVDTGFGNYVTREDVEQRKPARVAHIIGELPGVAIVPVGVARYQIVMSRYRYFGPDGRPGPCWPVVYVDGMRIGISDESIDDFVDPNDVEGIEVYKGAATVPGEFGGADATCGVIAVWTRRAVGEGKKWDIAKILAIPALFIISFILFQ
ncbi:MAG: carboxypeptidase-like regulatory domain-containing protein [Gemmatimonadota bacterium]|nr:MAG: carboxypeptidase-like regulatory domain-containing protein [Gemmatimonadota bacterium]